MASLLKKKKSSKKPSTVILPILLVCCVLAAFFYLPEIIGTFTGDRDNNEIAILETESLDYKNDSYNVIESIDDLLETPLNKKPETKIIYTSDTVEVEEQIVSCSLPLESEDKTGYLLPLEGQLKWEDLDKPEIKKLLDEAEKNSRKLFTTIDPNRYQRSRFELSSFINAISTVKSGKKNGLMSPEEALLKLDYADSQVSRAFNEEQVDRDHQVVWSGISLAGIIREPLSIRLKSRLAQQFDPHLSLTDVEIVHDKVRNDVDFRKAPITINIRGYVLGEDTKQVNWFFGDRQWESRPVRLQKPDILGRRFFEVRNIRQDQYRVVSLRAISNDGIGFDKRYSFYPRVTAFRPQKRRDGRFFYRVPYQPFDPRLDRAFLLQQVRFDPSVIRPGNTEELDESPMVSF